MRIALACLIVAACSNEVAAQDTVATPAHAGAAEEETLHKHPQRARVLGALFPGAGHAYVGEYGRALRVSSMALSLVGGGYVIYVIDKCLLLWPSTAPCEPGPKQFHQYVGMAIIGAGLGVWIWGARDAGRRAERMNRNYGRTVTGSPLIEPSLSDGVGARVGLTLRW